LEALNGICAAMAYKGERHKTRSDSASKGDAGGSRLGSKQVCGCLKPDRMIWYKAKGSGCGAEHRLRAVKTSKRPLKTIPHAEAECQSPEH